LLAKLDEYDLAIGSRAVNRELIEVHESVFREFAGIIFNRIVRVICGCHSWTHSAGSRRSGAKVSDHF